jgi:hypothetical protein
MSATMHERLGALIAMAASLANVRGGGALANAELAGGSAVVTELATLCCSCDAMRISGTASRHLAYLKRSGLVRVRRERSWSYYSLAEPRNPFHAKLLECLSSCFVDVPELERDGRRIAAARQRARCCD